MKDMPALLAAILAVRDLELLAQVFPRVIDSGKMRNFVQILQQRRRGAQVAGHAAQEAGAALAAGGHRKQLLNAAVGNALRWRTWSRWCIPSPPRPGARPGSPG